VKGFWVPPTLRGYHTRWLGADAMAALTLVAVALPSQMAPLGSPTYRLLSACTPSLRARFSISFWGPDLVCRSGRAPPSPRCLRQTSTTPGCKH
jgi:hypothetical protein